MSKEEMIPILRDLNITQWRDAGFKGQGITVWSCEDETGNAGHGSCVKQMILDVAPEANVIAKVFGFGTSGDFFTQVPSLTDGTLVEDFIKEVNPQIMTSSLYGNSKSKAWVDYMKRIQSTYNIPIFNAAGNFGSSEAETIESLFPSEVAILMAALNYSDGKFTRALYSSVGKEIDFAQSVGWWSGTSAAAPFQVGMCSIIMSRYGAMSHTELYKYLKMIAKDKGDVGVDTFYGWGQPILPDVNKKYITMTVGKNEYKINGLTVIIDTVPVNVQGNVFVPVRAISEALNYTVEWDNPVISISNGATKVTLTIGSDLIMINGRKVYLNFPPYIDGNGRTLVPIRAIAEAFGCKVDWVQNESKVMILEV